METKSELCSSASQPKMHRIGLGVSLLESYRHVGPSPSRQRRRRLLAPASLQFSSCRKIQDGEEDSMRGYPDTLLNDEEEKKEASMFPFAGFLAPPRLTTRDCDEKIVSVISRIRKKHDARRLIHDSRFACSWFVFLWIHDS